MYNQRETAFLNSLKTATKRRKMGYAEIALEIDIDKQAQRDSWFYEIYKLLEPEINELKKLNLNSNVTNLLKIFLTNK